MTVADIRNNPVIAYEEDCVTRLIQDDVNEAAYNRIKNWSISELREYVLSDDLRGRHARLPQRPDLRVAGVDGGGICSNADLIYGGRKCR